MKVYIGSDHRGYLLKEKIFQFLVNEGYDVTDFGAYEHDPTDDYTVYAEKVAAVVGKNTTLKGILLCGSGVGVDIVANKFDGVRAAVAKSSDQIQAGRSDDDMNVLVIAADYTDEKDARKIVKIFLETKFTAKARYKKRLEEIKRIEQNN